MKYLPITRPKLVPKWKMFRIYWSLVAFLFQICWSRFWCQKGFIKYLPPGRDPNLSQNWKCPECIKTWNICYFKYADLSFNVKNNFYEIFTTFLAQSVSKIKNPQKLLKFETIDIWICCQSQIFHMLSKMIFIKNLPPVRAKLVPKLKVLRVYWNLAQLTFRTSRSRFWCQK